MSILSGAFARHYIGLVLTVAAALESCAPPALRLPSCWQASDLKRGATFRGAVLIFGYYDTRPMMFPISCDGGVIADMPEDFKLPAPREPQFSEPLENRFFEAEVTGKVIAVEFGRPSVQLQSVTKIRQMTPRWLHPIGREPSLSD